jgi:DNA polymerase-3 subunit beta
MQFVAQKENLLSELSLIQGVVEKRSTKPILGNVLLETDSSIVSASATDMEVGLMSQFEAEIVKPGAITVPAKKLADIVRLLPDNNKVTFEVLDNSFIRITSGKIEYKLAGAAKEEFPELPSSPDADEIQIPAGILKKMIGRTIFAITAEETRYALNGAQLAFSSDYIRMVTTDAHRLAYVEYPFEGPEEAKEILVPRKTVSELKTLIDERLDTVFFSSSENHLFFRIGKRVLHSRTLDGQFPNYEKVLPKDNDKMMVINREQFAAAISRVALLSHEASKAIKLTLNPGTMRISSSHPEIGEAKEDLDLQYNGPEDLSVGFNSKYMNDFINTVSCEEVILEIKDEATAGLMKPAEKEEGSYKYVIMPMRI